MTHLTLKSLLAGSLLAGVWVGAASVALASGGRMMSGSMPQQMPQSTPQTAAQKAAGYYNQGVRLTHKADDIDKSAAGSADPGKKAKAAHEAQDKYTDARKQFEQAVQTDPSMAEAWNYLGYTNRKLGSYDQALAAYQKALALKPGYPDAIEYQGEAYLGMSHLPDAKQSYLDLYATNRELAQKLLNAMHAWVTTQRAAPGGAPAGVDDFDKWVQERDQIAHTTAALTRAGTAAAWR
jgi:tetratricopeptide (TPR) repeat protein